MAPLRLRHPKGISTLQLDLDTATVQDLLQAIFSVSEIPPSAQDRALKSVPFTLPSYICLSQSRIPATRAHRRHTRASNLQSRPGVWRSINCQPKARLYSTPKRHAYPIIGAVSKPARHHRQSSCFSSAVKSKACRPRPDTFCCREQWSGFCADGWWLPRPSGRSYGYNYYDTSS